MTRFEIKIVVALLLIAIVPLLASVALVGQVIRVTDGVAAGQAARLSRPLDHAAQAYRQLFSTLKTAFGVRAELMARDPALLTTLAAGDQVKAARRLTTLLAEDKAAGRAEVLDAQGRIWTEQDALDRPSGRDYRDLEVRRPLGNQGFTLRTVFYTPREPFRHFRQLGRARSTADDMARLRGDLGTYYRIVFFILFGAVLICATGTGLLIARRTARRVAKLASATRQVAEGDLDTRVELHSRDELEDLARAFNDMVHQIKQSGERIAYLEKIGAWQQIARRLAHEIKNPLTPIQLAMQQVHRKYDGDNPKFARMLDDARDIITEEVDALRRLVQAFSSFAKLPEVQPQAEDLNGLIDDFLKSRTEMQERATIRWTPVDPPLTVRVDRMLLKHVLFNLLENAVHAAEDAGTADQLTITIEAEEDDERGRTRLTVVDNGPGMPADVVARVFDPYFTTKDHGTGLGLAIVKKIVLEHGGTIDVTSSPDQGATFVLTLPLADSED